MGAWSRSSAVLVLVALGACAAVERAPMACEEPEEHSPPAKLVAVKERRVARVSAYRAGSAAARPATPQCPFGTPRLDPAWGFGPTRVISRAGYALEHSAIEKIPLWVCEKVDANELVKGSSRKNKFAPDPELKGMPRAELEDYKGSGYDRGHQAPAADYASSQERMDETFFLSNMAPQTKDLNQRVWKKLETLVRAWAEERSTIYVITGPLFYDADEEDPAKADGLVESPAIGAGGVSVPTHFYKIIVAQDAHEAIAFVLPNGEYTAPYELEPYRRSIDWIEARAGIDFMPERDAAVIEAAEPAMWR